MLFYSGEPQHLSHFFTNPLKHWVSVFGLIGVQIPPSPREKTCTHVVQAFSFSIIDIFTAQSWFL